MVFGDTGMKLTKGTQLELNVVLDGNSLAIRLEQPIAEWMGVKVGDKVIIVLEEGKYGPYIGVGKKGQHTTV